MRELKPLEVDAVGGGVWTPPPKPTDPVVIVEWPPPGPTKPEPGPLL